ncbi:hypothetical protein E5Q_06766 [Mixia osmundae IAM 14324]|uniref:Uncharacterized protein n=1 Tax=Mixia osmundae (strain CBS 9802 / IAM 14324 / JCM 22182 / KY 12970) TaxID=764103 RepID=G7EB52_MIXOS|nr:hypothetical protein E5Q_06766 [Mixia osmundae IAM 14324]
MDEEMRSSHEDEPMDAAPEQEDFERMSDEVAQEDDMQAERDQEDEEDAIPVDIKTPSETLVLPDEPLDDFLKAHESPHMQALAAPDGNKQGPLTVAALHDGSHDRQANDALGFRSPPRVMSRDDGRQISVLGRSAVIGRDGLDLQSHAGRSSDAVRHRTPDANGAIQRHGDVGDGSVEPDDTRGGALASNSEQSQSTKGSARSHIIGQSQRSKSEDQEQEQTMSGGRDGSVNMKQTQEQSTDKSAESDKQVNNVKIQETDDDGSAVEGDGSQDEGGDGADAESEDEAEGKNFKVTTNQQNIKGGKKGGDEGAEDSEHATTQINRIEVHRRSDNCGSGTHAGSTAQRPTLNKKGLSRAVFSNAMLAYYDPPDAKRVRDVRQTSTPPLCAPPVLITVRGQLFALFCEHESDLESYENGDPSTDPDASTIPVLLGESHELYYNQLENLITELHIHFEFFYDEQLEMTICIDDLDIQIPEDNVYTRELSLYDLERLHRGCDLPGRLRLTIAESPRLVFRFNTLADYMANSLGDSAEESSPVEGQEGHFVEDALSKAIEAEKESARSDDGREESNEAPRDEDEADDEHAGSAGVSQGEDPDEMEAAKHSEVDERQITDQADPVEDATARHELAGERMNASQNELDGDEAALREIAEAEAKTDGLISPSTSTHSLTQTATALSTDHSDRASDMQAREAIPKRAHSNLEGSPGYPVDGVDPAGSSKRPKVAA